MDRLMLMAMGGYGDMGMGMDTGTSAGLIDSLKAKLAFLPEWASVLVIALLVILLAMLVGWIGGKIVGSILYPDPDKQSVLTKKQKFIVLGGAIAAIALSIFALTYTPPADTGEDALPTGGEVSTDGMEGMDGMNGTDVPEEGEPTEGEPEGEDAGTEEAQPDETVTEEPAGESVSVTGGMVTGGGVAVAVPMG